LACSINVIRLYCKQEADDLGFILDKFINHQ